MEEKTPVMRCVEFDHGQPLERLITEAIEGGTSWEQLALDLGVSRFTLRDWTRKLGLKFVTRTTRVPEAAGVD